MNKSLLIFSLCCLSLWTMAQDIIVTTDAKKIDAKILEVSKSEIKYKEIDNLDGPTFILEADLINNIIYSNGKVVLYNQGSPISHKEETEKEEMAIRKAEQLASLFDISETNSEKEEHITPSIRGNSWNMQGRSLVGKLAMPSYDGIQEGSVIVEIVVNPTGDVISAIHIGGTITDNKAIQSSLNAAHKAKFSKSENNQIGTITYNFKLK